MDDLPHIPTHNIQPCHLARAWVEDGKVKCLTLSRHSNRENAEIVLKARRAAMRPGQYLVILESDLHADLVEVYGAQDDLDSLGIPLLDDVKYWPLPVVPEKVAGFISPSVHG